MILFHLTTRAAWDAARAAGVYEPPSLATEGFIHLSTRSQWLRVLNRFYRDVPDQLLLAIDEDKLGAPLSHESVDGDVFPHLYGPLEVAAVVDTAPLPGVVPMPPGLDGALRAVANVTTVALCVVRVRNGWAQCLCLGGATPEQTQAITLRDATVIARPLGIEATFLQLHGPVDLAGVARWIDAD